MASSSTRSRKPAISRTGEPQGAEGEAGERPRLRPRPSSFDGRGLNHPESTGTRSSGVTRPSAMSPPATAPTVGRLRSCLGGSWRSCPGGRGSSPGESSRHRAGKPAERRTARSNTPAVRRNSSAVRAARPAGRPGSACRPGPAPGGRWRKAVRVKGRRTRWRFAGCLQGSLVVHATSPRVPPKLSRRGDASDRRTTGPPVSLLL
jgi:hypothetical protein